MVCMSFKDIIDPKTKDIRVNIDEEIDLCISELVMEYGWLVREAEIAKSPDKFRIAAHKLERSQEFIELKQALYKANEHLDPKNMDSWAQREDMRISYGGVLNSSLREKAKEMKIENFPEQLFNEAKTQR